MGRLRFLKIAVAICLPGLLFGCQTTQGTAPRTPLIAVGQTFTGSVQFGRYSIPLPKGEWTVSGSSVDQGGIDGTGYSATGGFYARGRLINLKSGDELAIVTNVTPGYSVGKQGYVKSKICARKSLHHTKVTANDAGDKQDCWALYHSITRFNKNPNSASGQTKTFFEAKGLIRPVNTMNVRYRFADDDNYLKITYIFDPDIRGIKPTQYSTWGTSEWHIDRIASYPDKTRFVAVLRKWGTAMYPEIRASFSGGKPTAIKADQILAGLGKT